MVLLTASRTNHP